jgi:hypothetical protein
MRGQALSLRNALSLQALSLQAARQAARQRGNLDHARRAQLVQDCRVAALPAITMAASLIAMTAVQRQ